MNDTSPKLTVIATRMPYIDRRSLSEAWFSALHLAAATRQAHGTLDRRNASHEASQTRRLPESADLPIPERDLRPRPRTSGTERMRAGAELTTRRAHDARLAANARAAFERARSYPPFRSSLTLDARGERVQLLLRREGATLHVVALCRPELAETVRRALACADLHVRTRGEAIRSSVEIVSPSVVKA